MNAVVLAKCGPILVSFGREGQIPERDFRAWMDALRDPEVTAQLSAAVGTLHMSLAQRKQAASTAKKRDIRTAVLTDDRVGRGVVTAVSWLGADIRAFAWEDVNKASEFLMEKGSHSSEALTETVWRLRRELLGDRDQRRVS
jgi:hypothetical protein